MSDDPRMAVSTPKLKVVRRHSPIAWAFAHDDEANASITFYAPKDGLVEIQVEIIEPPEEGSYGFECSHRRTWRMSTDETRELGLALDYMARGL